MITIETRQNLVSVAVLGEFTLVDYRQFEAAVDYTVQQFQGGASLLIDLRDMTGFTLDVAWEEIKFSRRHAHDFNRIAVVATDEWVIWSAWISRAFVDAEIRVFDESTMAEDWVTGRESEASEVRATLVSTAELAANLDDWIVCDCRYTLADKEAGRAAYTKGHIPGARFMDLGRDLASAPSGSNGRHPLPGVEALEKTLGAAGIDASKQVVAYDDAGGAYAARLWWLLRWLGHDAVAVLDGGIDRWIKEGRELSVVVPGPEPAQFRASPRPEMSVGVGELVDNLSQRKLVVLDARTAERFRGINETLDPVGGHIPGARNRYYKENLEADGSFKSSEQLRLEFDSVLGETDPESVVNQCGSGVTACHNLLAMEIAGLPGTKLYPGSWSEWCADPARPVEK
jgi:thiosulfate/3-mercaptopyruvate sulfurtransferase